MLSLNKQQTATTVEIAPAAITNVAAADDGGV